MGLNRHTSGLLMVALLAVVGYLLVSLPPTVIAQYKDAAELSPTWGYVYLATVGLGALVLTGLAGWVFIRLWRNTRRKRQKRERRRRSPSELSPREQEQELRENLEEGEGFAEGREVPDDVRREIRDSVAGLKAKLESEKLEIVAFGTISSGKSSLLNTLAGREMFRSEPRGGTTLTRSDVPWPGDDRVILADTPGLAEVQGEARAAEAAAAAKDADLVLFVVDGPLKAYEVDLLRQLGAMEKRTLVCLNKEDWFGPEDRDQLVAQIAEQVAPWVPRENVVAVQARPISRRRVRVLPDGTETDEAMDVAADIYPLAERMMALVQHEGRDLLLANLLLQSRGLVEASKTRVRAALDARAEEIVARHMWAAGGVAAANPIPLLDLAGGAAVTVKMILDLARVYHQSIDGDTAVRLLAQLSKSLIAMLGVTAAAPVIVSVLGATLKTVPGVGMIAGGMIQGLVQALVTRWIGKVFIEYFRSEMAAPPEALAELARSKWEEVTQPEQLLKLIQAGRQRLTEKED